MTNILRQISKYRVDIDHVNNVYLVKNKDEGYNADEILLSKKRLDNSISTCKENSSHVNVCSRCNMNILKIQRKQRMFGLILKTYYEDDLKGSLRASILNDKFKLMGIKISNCFSNRTEYLKQNSNMKLTEEIDDDCAENDLKYLRLNNSYINNKMYLLKLREDIISSQIEIKKAILLYKNKALKDTDSLGIISINDAVKMKSYIDDQVIIEKNNSDIKVKMKTLKR